MSTQNQEEMERTLTMIDRGEKVIDSLERSVPRLTALGMTKVGALRFSIALLELRDNDISYDAFERGIPGGNGEKLRSVG